MSNVSIYTVQINKKFEGFQLNLVFFKFKIQGLVEILLEFVS